LTSAPHGLRRPPARGASVSVLARVRRYRAGCWCELGLQVGALVAVAGLVAWLVRWERVGPVPVPATQIGYMSVLLTTVSVLWLLGSERGWRRLARVARLRCWRERWREALGVASQLKLSPGQLVTTWRARYGVALVVAIPRGKCLADYRALEDRLATALGAPAGVRVRQHHRQPRLIHVRVRERDPLMEESPVDRLPERTSWREPFELGVDEDGRPVRVDLIRAVHVLVGGTPGSGKSTLAHLPIAHLALDPRVSLRLLDGKEGIELADWAPAADAYAHEEPLMLTVLEQAYGDMQRRAAWMREHGLKSYAESPRLHPVAVVADEFTTLTDSRHPWKGPDGRKSTIGAEATRLLRLLARLGRAPGVHLMLITQRPDARTVDGTIRDNLPCRVAMRVLTPDASDVILGRGNASCGYDASQITTRGVGILHLDGQLEPRPFRSHYLAGHVLREAQRCATQVRQEAERA
jgi:DNA segregation ATPase FtsK/SpoIIIE, S-DNA-T family